MSSRPAIACLLLAMLATAACDRKSPAPEQATTSADEVSPDEAPAAAPTAGAGRLDRSHKGEPAPAITFADPAGKPVTLAAFKGKPVLLNLWATWCAPCVKEMPTLDAAAAAAGDRLTVLAVSQDMDAAKVAPFFGQRKFERLRPYTDAKMALSLGYGANLPTTILYDAAGKEVWRVTGDRDWTGTEAQKLIAEAA